MRGTHCLLHWSRTQQLISLSSAEAELNASITAGCEGLLIKHMVRETGSDVEVCIRGDSSANSGIVHRAGTGRVKHLEIRQLWLQQKVGVGAVKNVKIPRGENLSDTQTHYWTREEGRTHFPKMNAERRGLEHAGAMPSHKGGLDSIHLYKYKKGYI